MTTVAERRSHEQHVSALLEQLAGQRQHLYALKAWGARPAGLRDLKAELRETRTELAAAVEAAAGDGYPDGTRASLAASQAA
jgi:hypothetical protein